MKDRNKEFDSLKFIAILVIYITHFIAQYNSSYFYFWQVEPTKYFLSGITGKLGVAVFGVILGYFAYNSGKNKTLADYSLKRYGYFVFAGLVINTIYCLWFKLPYNNILKVSFSIGADIFPTYWCMKEFLISSILAFCMGKSDLKYEIKLLIIVILLLAGQTWIPICLMGTLLSELIDSKIFKNVWVRLLLFIIIFMLIQRPESIATYILDGVFALIIICIIKNSKIIKKLMNNRIISSLGSKTMAIFILHPIMYQIIGKWLFDNYFQTHGLDFIIVCVICFVAICLMSYPFTWLLNLYSKFYNFVKNRIIQPLLNK